MQVRLCFTRLSTVALLLVCALPVRANAQRFVCSPIAPGETATSLARRLTGSAASAYGHLFQIRDPARLMFVPKSHYQRLQSDWQACIASGPVLATPVAYAPSVELAASASAPTLPAAAPLPLAFVSAPQAAGAAWPLSDLPLTATIGAALVLIGVMSAVAGPLARRPIPPAARRAGENFVSVFARPLVDESSGIPPIEARFRFLRRRQQLEISMAPGPGHRYPNLTDHKHNVEYDVDRVIGVLRHYVLAGPPRAAGRWVIVTIRPAAGKGLS
ncbi:MAG TPA: hypothetical protein VFV78_10405 [Vicinamibacterales bacterium]|nr:hypothetical protein [Vicinamibacterales bacterium]